MGYNIPKDRLKEWCTNWKGLALGNFAQALHYALEIKPELDNPMVNRIRTVMQAFQQYETEIIKQMCQVNMKGKVIERGFEDDQTGKELSRIRLN